MRDAVAWCLAALLCGCSVVGGDAFTPRPNQRTVFQGRLWVDENCKQGRGSINCCTRHDAICPDFTDYDLVDVRVKGTRVAALIAVNNGVTLSLSDDSGESWRELGVGSVGNLPEAQSLRLHLAGDDVYLLALRSTPVPLGFRVTTRPYKVDLSTGVTTDQGVELLTLGRAFSAEDGTVFGALVTPEDARNPGGRCIALFESWRPGSSQVEVKQVLSSVTACGIDMPVLAADDARFLPLPMALGDRACTLQYDAAANTLGGSCVPWGLWPPARNRDSMRHASFAGKRALRLAAFSLDGQAWASPFSSAEWISLGPGTPGDNWTLSNRQRYAGLVSLGTRWVRVNEDRTVDEAVLPLGPCTDPTKTCFDSGNGQTWHGEVGAVLWLEPLGNDDYLVFSMHDDAAGAERYHPRVLVSKEKASWKRVEPQPPPTTLGPAGFPDAQEAGPLEKMCLSRLSCGRTNDFYNCLGAMQSTPPTQPGLEAAITASFGAACTGTTLDPAAFTCAVRGGRYVVPADGQGGPSCEFSADFTGVTCGNCVGTVGFACGTNALVDCGAGGLACTGGACAAESCTASGCVGDRYVGCTGGKVTSAVRCDLLNMRCDTTAFAPGWSPCIGKGTWAPSMTNAPLRCEGPYVMWHINGEKFADCTALGFSGCAGGRCTP